VEEDVLGTMRTLSAPATYVGCSRCGRVTLQRDIHVISSDALESKSEFEYVCPACYKALAGGEQELPIAEP
jgi:hypothetical protein